MREQKDIERLYNFVGAFNEGRFMNQDYRRGIIDALSYVLYGGEVLETVLIKASNLSKKK